VVARKNIQTYKYGEKQQKMAQNARNQPRMYLLGVSQKLLLPPRLYPPNSENFCITKAPFLLKTRITLVVSATKIRNRIGNSPWGFQLWVKNLTGSGILAVFAHAQQKIG